MRKYPNPLRQLMQVIVRDATNTRLGKIETRNHGWILSDKGYTNPQGVYLKPRNGINGLVSLSGKRMVTNCPEPPIDRDSWAKMNTGFNVTKSVCLKCPNRIQGGYCKILRIEAK